LRNESVEEFFEGVFRYDLTRLGHLHFSKMRQYKKGAKNVLVLIFGINAGQAR